MEGKSEATFKVTLEVSKGKEVGLHKWFREEIKIYPKDTKLGRKSQSLGESGELQEMWIGPLLFGGSLWPTFSNPVKRGGW